MSRSIAFALCLASSSALRIGSPTQAQPSAALKLRGGGNAGLIVSATAAIGGATGVSMFLGTEKFTQYLWLGLNKFPHDKYIAVAMIGWAIGKISAVRAGDEDTKSFAQLNTIPLALWLVANVQKGAAVTTSILPAALLAAYVYA